jgi:uncharacterized protein (DUF2132 family)
VPNIVLSRAGIAFQGGADLMFFLFGSGAAGRLCAFSRMAPSQSNNPLHGITLEMMLLALVDHYGWDELGRIIDIRCFNFEPSIKSSLQFLRRTPWARKKVEDLYLWIKSAP